MLRCLLTEVHQAAEDEICGRLSGCAGTCLWDTGERSV